MRTGTAPLAVGEGEFTIDYAVPEPDPPPVTTIAWELALGYVREPPPEGFENYTLWGDSVVLRDPEGNEFCVS